MTSDCILAFDNVNDKNIVFCNLVSSFTQENREKIIIKVHQTIERSIKVGHVSMK